MIALGIATWGVIDNRAVLEGDEGRFPAVYNARDCRIGHTMLDCNHSHFLLADNGTQNVYGVEIELRAKLEVSLMQNCALKRLARSTNITTTA